ncbi:MAG TPA: hypothetical protein PKJ85_10800 [Nitrosomonas nitrosa]|nr:hypothetical protein [Nitrosomonas nitrosa]
MKIVVKIMLLVGLWVSCHLVWADRIGGSPRADFSSNELTVPCVLVKNFDDEAINDQYFDIILERRGNSFNYDLTFAEPEDHTHCQRVANFAVFDDDDFDDNASPGNGGTDTSNILVSCEKRSNRSKISVDGKNLVVGNYSSTVTSGDESVSSPVKSSVGDEIEFDYDSAADDIAEGATVISADFIQNGTISAVIVDNSDNLIASVNNAVCAVRN